MLDVTTQLTGPPCPVLPDSITQRLNIYKRPMVAGLQRTLKRHHGKLRSKMKKPSKCVVCLEKASGMYFGAMVCLPCKSFFIRCTKDGKPQLTCLGDKNCSIDRTNRMRCQYCRYQKCLAAGMMRREKPECVEPAEGQELCRVCSDIANGIHFGVMTCEGCKKFFRRALKEADTYECKLQQLCTLNPRNRNACRFCRYQKCLDVGMSRQAIRMGRPKKIKTESVSSYNDYCNYDTSTIDPYYCSKMAMNPNIYNGFKIEPQTMGYGSSPTNYQQTHPSSPHTFESHKYNSQAPVSPGNDSGIESDCGSPVHVLSPTEVQFPNIPIIKTEPADMYENTTNCVNNCSSSQYNQVDNFSTCNAKAIGYQQSESKMDISELDSLVPTLATELDVEDMNDILAALGQHMGNLGQHDRDIKSLTMQQQQFSNTNDSRAWCQNNQAFQTRGLVSSPAVTNTYVKETSCVTQTSSFPCPQYQFPATNFYQVGSPVWPSHVPSYQANHSNKVYFGNQRQPVFPMFVS